MKKLSLLLIINMIAFSGFAQETVAPAAGDAIQAQKPHRPMKGKMEGRPEGRPMGEKMEGARPEGRPEGERPEGARPEKPMGEKMGARDGELRGARGGELKGKMGEGRPEGRPMKGEGRPEGRPMPKGEAPAPIAE